MVVGLCVWLCDELVTWAEWNLWNRLRHPEDIQCQRSADINWTDGWQHHNTAVSMSSPYSQSFGTATQCLEYRVFSLKAQCV